MNEMLKVILQNVLKFCLKFSAIFFTSSELQCFAHFLRCQIKRIIYRHSSTFPEIVMFLMILKNSKNLRNLKSEVTSLTKKTKKNLIASSLFDLSVL